MAYINEAERQDIINGLFEFNAIKEASIIKRNSKFDLLNTTINVAAVIINNKGVLYCQEDYYEPTLHVVDTKDVETVFHEVVKQKIMEIRSNCFFDFCMESKCNFIFKDSLNEVKKENEEHSGRTR